jgi:ABC-type transporter Mla subunit MlaD
MVEERVYVQRGPSGVGVLLGLIVVAAVVLAVLWGTGVMTVGRDAQNRLHITFDANQAEHAGDDVLDKTGKALEHAGERLERQAHKPNTPEPVQR